MTVTKTMQLVPFCDKTFSPSNSKYQGSQQRCDYLRPDLFHFAVANLKICFTYHK